MNMKLNLNLFLLLLISFILFIFLTRECNRRKYIELLEDENELYINKELKFEITENKLNQEVATQKAIIRYKDNLLAKELAENNNLKNIITGIKATIVTKIVPTPVYLDSIITLTDSTKCLPLPVKFKRGDKWWNEAGTITSKGYLESDSLTFMSEPMIAVGYKKRTLKTLLKIPELVITYRDRNPYATINSLENIIIQDKPKRFGIGLHLGYGVATNGLSPVISIGINYNLIKF